MGFSSLDVVLTIKSYKAWLARNKQRLPRTLLGHLFHPLLYRVLCFHVYLFLLRPYEFLIYFVPEICFFAELNYHNRNV